MACPFCRARTADGSMCKQCGKSYDRTAHRRGDVLEAMEWAAKRAWYFAAQRQKLGQRADEPKTVAR